MKVLIKRDLEACEKVHNKFTSIENYEDRHSYVTFAYRFVNKAFGNALDFKALVARALPYSEA